MPNIQNSGNHNRNKMNPSLYNRQVKDKIEMRTDQMDVFQIVWYPQPEIHINFKGFSFRNDSIMWDNIQVGVVFMTSLLPHDC